MDETYRLAKEIYAKISSKKIGSIKMLNVEKLTPLADIFIIVVASNVRLTKAISDEMEDYLAERGYLLRHKEGYSTAKWILMDYGQIIIHLLDEEDADFYDLEHLWSDAEEIQ